jgi:hypothetical protein
VLDCISGGVGYVVRSVAEHLSDEPGFRTDVCEDSPFFVGGGRFGFGFDGGEGVGYGRVVAIAVQYVICYIFVVFALMI